MCYFISMVPQVSFLNICICWTIAYFFKTPLPPSFLKAEKYIKFMCIVYKEIKREEKKAKKIMKEKKQLNIFWINIWLFLLKYFLCCEHFLPKTMMCVRMFKLS